MINFSRKRLRLNFRHKKTEQNLFLSVRLGLSSRFALSRNPCPLYFDFYLQNLRFLRDFKLAILLGLVRNSVLPDNSYMFSAKRVTDTAPLVIYSRMFVVMKSTPQETSFSAYSGSFTIQQLIFIPRRLSSAIFSSFKDI